jgi:hypothetical protein
MITIIGVAVVAFIIGGIIGGALMAVICMANNHDTGPKYH